MTDGTRTVCAITEPLVSRRRVHGDLDELDLGVDEWLDQHHPATCDVCSDLADRANGPIPAL
jgi:hypothetical protein